jgi:hypothetical protein
MNEKQNVGRELDEAALLEAKQNCQTLFSQALNMATEGHGQTKSPIQGALSIAIHQDGNYTISVAGLINKGTLLGALTDAQLKIHDMAREWENEQIAERFEALIERASIPPTDLQ